MTALVALFVNLHCEERLIVDILEELNEKFITQVYMTFTKK